MKKVTIEPGCTACGVCEFLAPDVFEVADVARVKSDANFVKNDNEIKQAVQSCPVNVIKYEE